MHVLKGFSVSDCNVGKDDVTPNMGSFHAQCRKTNSCLLSFVETPYIRYIVRAVLKFGKQASPFSCHKEQKYILPIIGRVIVLSFSDMCFLENIC